MAWNLGLTDSDAPRPTASPLESLRNRQGRDSSALQYIASSTAIPHQWQHVTNALFLCWSKSCYQTSRGSFGHENGSHIALPSKTKTSAENAFIQHDTQSRSVRCTKTLSPFRRSSVYFSLFSLRLHLSYIHIHLRKVVASNSDKAFRFRHDKSISLTSRLSEYMPFIQITFRSLGRP